MKRRNTMSVHRSGARKAHTGKKLLSKEIPDTILSVAPRRVLTRVLHQEFDKIRRSLLRKVTKTRSPVGTTFRPPGDFFPRFLKHRHTRDLLGAK